MLFSHEGSLVLTLAILSCQRKIDSNERSKGRNSNTLKKVYSMGHIFTAWYRDKKKQFYKAKGIILKKGQLRIKKDKLNAW